MADQAIAAQVDVNPLKTYSQILGVQQQAQTLQTGKYLQQSAQAGAIERQQQAHEMQAGVPLLQDPVGSGLVDEDGTPTKQAQQILARAMPTTWKQHYDALIGAAQGKVQLQNSFLGMSNEARNIVTSRVAGVAADGKSGTAEILNAIDDAEEQYRGTPDEKPVSKAAGLLRDGIGKIKDKGLPVVRQYVLAANRGGLGPSGITGAGGVGAPGNLLINRGGVITPATQAPALAGGEVSTAPGAMSTTLGPQVVTTPRGDLEIWGGDRGSPKPTLTKAPKPAASNAVPAPWFKDDGTVRTAVDDAPASNAPTATQEQYRKSADIARTYVDQVRDADEQYGTNVAISNAIRRLAKDTKTGPGTQTWQNVLAAIGAPIEIQTASDYHTLGSLLDRQAAMLRQTMGLPGTNAGQQTAESISGNTALSPATILYKNDFNQSLVEGMHQFRRGLDRVEGFSGNPSPKAVQAFRSQWIDKFDPSVYELENARRRLSSDPNAITEAVGRLTPEQAASVRQKRKALQALSNAQAPNE